MLNASGTAIGTCVDNAGNSATAMYTAHIDTVAPTVNFAGNKGNYGVLDTVAISCTATDALSGIDTSTCPVANGPAWAFGAGSHTLSAQATDKAGNARSASTTFTVTVTAADLQKLTKNLVVASAKYQSSSTLTKSVIMSEVKLAQSALTGMKPSTPPAKKAQHVALYKSDLSALVGAGCLTTTQQAILVALASAI